MHTVSVAIKSPAYSAFASVLSYESEHPLTPGSLVRVPLGKAELLGIVWPQVKTQPERPAAGSLPQSHAAGGSEPTAITLRPIAGSIALPALSPAWCALIDFAARYYQRSVGEVAMAALPPPLRELDLAQLQRRLSPPAPSAASAASKRARAAKAAAAASAADQAPAAEVSSPTTDAPEFIAVNDRQIWTIEQFEAENDASTGQKRPTLLFGATGSGKTEVYLQLVARLLARSPGAQALVLVPEINLTPQLLARFKSRFEPLYGPQAVASLHSGLTPTLRLKHWLSAHTGEARIVLGTRLAVFASMPGLGLIVVDEEHDPSYKSNDGARYSARDLAVWRGRAEGCGVLLGSATPSLESWHASEPQGRYARLTMAERVGGGALARLRIANMDRLPKGTVLAPALVAAIAQRVAAGEQTLLLLNRRGYAPVLHCADCEWKSECPHCSAYRVFHKIDRSLRCHHCGAAERVPRACPSCGSLDLAMIGKGTERLEESVGELLSGITRPDGSALRIARIDADTTRAKGALETQLAAIHNGEVDVLVGTQMVAKGHDFRKMTLVAALNVDAGLFSSDYRSPERLFSLLMQAGGRAGRDAALSAHSELWVQTYAANHPLFAALARHDFVGFAGDQLRQRLDAGLPPHAHQALLRAEGRSQEATLAFLNAAAAAAATCSAAPRVTIFPPVPMSPQRVANTERTQMLLESDSRPALQSLLAELQSTLHVLNPARGPERISRWAVDVDPLYI